MQGKDIRKNFENNRRISNLFVLYPYSRFVYESIVEYIFGNNIVYCEWLDPISSKDNYDAFMLYV